VHVGRLLLIGTRACLGMPGWRERLFAPNLTPQTANMLIDANDHYACRRMSVVRKNLSRCGAVRILDQRGDPLIQSGCFGR